jgi:hypothetical protein
MNPLFRFFKRFKLTRDQRALSSAIATLITLTASVVLSSTVVLFATNVTTSQMSKENLIIPITHLWYVDGSSSLAAIGLTNTGSTDVIINKITVKGINCQWNADDSSFILYNKINGAIPGDLPFTEVARPEATITIAEEPYTFSIATQGLSLKAGSSMACYIALPGNLMIYDMGQPVRVVVSTTQAVYTIEANVEAPS